jgi:hypothetical protein
MWTGKHDPIHAANVTLLLHGSVIAAPFIGLGIGFLLGGKQVAGLAFMMGMAVSIVVGWILKRKGI